MLKMLAGEPPKQFLVLGLSFGNIDKFKAQPADTYIRVNGSEFNLPTDVILYSGDKNRAFGKDKTSGKNVFMVGLDDEQLDRLRREPGKCLVTLDNAVYRIGFNLMIFSGETEASMAHEVNELIGPNTRVTTS